jgi:hypothetical protein
MLDADIMDASMSKEYFETLETLWGPFVYRVGLAPKFSVPFLTPSAWADQRKISSAVVYKGCAKCQVEVLGTGNQSVICGIHDIAKLPYEWYRGNLWDAVLPKIHALAQLENLLGGPGKTQKCRKSSFSPLKGVGEKECLMLLDRLDKRNPDAVDTYDDWIGVGMALHHQLEGSASGLAMWDSWSSKGKKYKTGVCFAKWRSFSSGK